jgi:hypothetical protein
MTPLVLEGAEGEAGRIVREYHAALPQRIAEAVSMAESSLIPARVSAGMGREDSISFNRRFLMKDGSVRMNPGQLNPEIVKPMGPIDPTITVAYFEDADQKPLATQVNFALHATCWGGRDFSADYPGVLARLLGDVKGLGMMTQFLQGASGNLNQVDVASKRRHFGAEITNRVGTILAAETLRTYSKLEDVSGSPLRVFSEIVHLPVPEFTADDVKQAQAVIERSRGPQPGRPAFLELVHAFTIINVTGRHQSKPLEAEVQVIALGDKLAWVGLPGEVFVELGMAVRAASPFQYTLISELANDMFDYFPDRKAFDQGGYEVVTARAKAGCGEMLVDAVRRLLAQAYRNQPGARYQPGFPGK